MSDTNTTHPAQSNGPGEPGTDQWRRFNHKCPICGRGLIGKPLGCINHGLFCDDKLQDIYNGNQ